MHIPVLQKEVIQYLNPKPNENFIDCTVGEGGHSSLLLEKIAPHGKVLGIDYQLRLKSRDRLILAEDNFANLKEIVQKEDFKNVSGILLDLGLSSWHLEESKRGFSFLRNESLDMRYNRNNPLTAEKIINYWSEADIERIVREYGEEKFSRQIVKAIINARKIRPIQKTLQLAKIIGSAVPGWYKRQKINFATKTFQALRIAVNNELANLEKVLPQAIEILKKEGRLVVISFQSLEDRIVKNFLKQRAGEEKIRILTKKPVSPLFSEIKINPRARSAKLRALKK